MKATWIGELADRRRFADRRKRIARRVERDRFAFFMVPIIWLLLLVGFAVLGALGWYVSVSGEVDLSWWGWAGIPVGVGISLAIFRVLRGHFSEVLDEL